ncbi:isoprenylcysteine carboxylmethyltransferase family protein [bacterium]|nr:isoprenylcysteine carboxylmethyltransferase family protein [bacterium]
MSPFNHYHRSVGGVLAHLAFFLVIGGQIALVFILEPHWSITWLRWVGYAIWGLSAVLGWLPIFIFRRRGGVEKGESYTSTQRMVTTGLYAVVRHPQFLALILLGVAAALLTPHWATIVGAVVISVATYIVMLSSDRRLMEKFGNEYREYIRQVPRSNILWGILKHFFRHRQNVKINCHKPNSGDRP